MGRLMRRRNAAQLERLARLEHEPSPIALGVCPDEAVVLDTAYGPWWKEWLGPMAPQHREAGLALLLEQATWTDVERQSGPRRCTWRADKVDRAAHDRRRQSWI
jgi:hypothetical protein